MKPALIINTHLRSQYLEAAIQLFRGQGAQLIVSHSGAKRDDMLRVLRDSVKIDPAIIYMEPEGDTIEYSIHKTWNRALKKLLPEGYDPIFVGDEGMVPSTGFVARIVSLMQTEPEIGIVGPIHQGGVPQQNIPPEDSPNFKDAPFDLLDLRRSAQRFQEAADKSRLHFRTVPAVESHIRAIRAQVFHDLGLFDENYMVGWMGDSEFCYDAKQNGWDTAVCYRAFIWHYRDLFYPLAKKNEWIAVDTGYALKRWKQGSILSQKLNEGFVERTG